MDMIYKQLKRIKLNIIELFKLKGKVNNLIQEIEHLKLLNGKMMGEFNKNKKAKSVSEVEFKVFSQYGDDGIINYLTSKLDISNKIFVEFGVENYIESNTRFLLMNDNWSGLVIDGSKANINYIKEDLISRKFDLKSKASFITAENINEVLSEANLPSEIGLLSIDIDGNDYWVWKAIKVIKPIIVISEYNSIWGFDKPYTVPYQPNFYRTDYHYSNLCYGSSLLSLVDLAHVKGYAFIGCNTMGNNAYFVRKDKLNDLFPSLSCEKGYVLSKFSESRNKKGNWTYLKGTDRLELLKNIEIFNTRTNKIEHI